MYLYHAYDFIIFNYRSEEEKQIWISVSIIGGSRNKRLRQVVVVMEDGSRRDKKI